MKKIMLLAALVGGVSFSGSGTTVPKHHEADKNEPSQGKKAVKLLDEEWSCSTAQLECRTMVVCGTPAHQQERREFLESPQGQDTYCP